jgi:integrase
MVKTNMKGVHKVTVRLADKSKKAYYYAWRGGPRMENTDPKSRDFMREYIELTADRNQDPVKGCLGELINEYKASPDFDNLADSTKEINGYSIKRIMDRYFDFPLQALSEKGARREFMQWRNDLAKERGLAAADRAMSILKRILQYGINMEMIDTHPLKDVNKVYNGSRKDIIWTDLDIKKLKAIDNEKITQALILGLWTGQRQGDLLKLRWNAYDGHTLSVEQSKTKTYVRVKVSAELKTMLDSMERTAVTILTNQAGKPWGSGFKSSWRKSCGRAGIEGLRFHDLRGTFVTLAWRNGATIEEISDVTGHSIKYAERIIRKHYLVSGGAVEKIEKIER